MNKSDLVYMRRGKRISQAEIAKHLGCTEALISMFENGKANMSLEKVRKYQEYVLGYGKEIA